MDIPMLFELIMTLLNAAPLCLSNFLKYFLIDNMIKTGLY